MSKDWVKDMVEFHMALGMPVLDKPAIPSMKQRELRIELIEEEVIRETLAVLHELADERIAAHQNDQQMYYAEKLTELADGITDSIVVLIGTALEFGINLQPCWDEVWKTNMAKKGGPIRPDGKRLKPPGWEPPNMAKAVFEAEKLVELKREVLNPEESKGDWEEKYWKLREFMHKEGYGA